MNKFRHPLIWVIIWLVTGFGLLCSYWLWDWRVLAGVATWVLAGGIFLACWQISEARKSTNAQIAMDLFDKLRSDRALEIIRYIYSLPPKEDGTYITVEHKHGIEYVLDNFDLLGALVAKDIVNEELAIEAFAGAPTLRCWYKLAPFVRKLQSTRGLYVIYFEDFSRRSLEHFNKVHVEIIFYREGEEDKYLVKELIELLEKKDELSPRNLKEIKRAFKEDSKRERG